VPDAATSLETVLEEYADRDHCLMFLLGLVATSLALLEGAGGARLDPGDGAAGADAGPRPAPPWPSDLLR
jgi:hypothetical protein